MEGWKTVPIGRVAEIFDGPHATPKIVDYGAIFLGIEALDRGRINLKKTRCVTPEDYKKWTRRVTPQQGDVVFSYETRLGEAALIPEGLTCCLGRRMGLVRAKQTLLDPNFFLYYYLSPIFQEVIRLKTILGATVNRISIKEFPTFPVLLPPLEQQQAIAHILGTLDDKIELNRRQNTTLEAMAQAIFKDWFVDFGPVRAKMEGRQPESMSCEMANLFPDYLDSEGKPEGWEWKALDTIANFLNGIALQKFPPVRDVYLPVIKIAELRSGVTDKTDKASRNIPDQYIIKNGDILFSWSGSLMQTIWTGGEGALNQHLFKVTSSSYPKWFYYLWLKKFMPEFQSIASSKATTMGHIQRCHLTKATTCIPNKYVLTAASTIFSPMIAKIISNKLEINTLTSLRDTLIPKLISGELRVPDAEKMVADLV